MQTMRSASTGFRTLLLTLAAPVVALTACRAKIRFPTGGVPFTSHGLSVTVDGGQDTGDRFAFHSPFVSVEVDH